MCTAISLIFNYMRQDLFQIGPMAKDHIRLSRYCDIRWHQTADMGYAPNPLMENTFMAVSVDLTDSTSPYGGSGVIYTTLKTNP